MPYAFQLYRNISSLYDTMISPHCSYYLQFYKSYFYLLSSEVHPSIRNLLETQSYFSPLSFPNAIQMFLYLAGIAGYTNPVVFGALI